MGSRKMFKCLIYLPKDRPLILNLLFIMNGKTPTVCSFFIHQLKILYQFTNFHILFKQEEKWFCSLRNSFLFPSKNLKSFCGNKDASVCVRIRACIFRFLGSTTLFLQKDLKFFVFKLQ